MRAALFARKPNAKKMYSLCNNFGELNYFLLLIKFVPVHKVGGLNNRVELLNTFAVEVCANLTV